jgi:hypothetical protein
MVKPTDGPSSVIERAAGLISEAMDLLDANSECPEASAYLDLALRKLREYHAKDRRGPSDS